MPKKMKTTSGVEVEIKILPYIHPDRWNSCYIDTKKRRNPDNITTMPDGSRLIQQDLGGKL